MKQLLALCLALLLTASLLGCSEKEAIKFYETKTYRKHSTGDINLSEKTYDENWNLLLDYVTLNGNFASKVEYEYSEDHRVLTTKTTSAIYPPEASTMIRTFDEKGQVIQAEVYDGDRQISTTEYAYDEKGEMVFSKSTQPGSDIVITLERIFDHRGNLVTSIQNTGYYAARYEYTYNKKNQRIREDYYRDGELLSYTEFTWEGSTGTGTHYKADGTPTGKILMEYDAFGNQLRYESQDLLGTTLSLSCMEYTGTDGSISSGIPE